ncbi:bifunctional adenosylcobinamide kinase/adenosylcobinamide-phosphate guanylyltransferase [Propylenella binzhouense]|uniref:Bifunctional adenosylcobalamin biosynthesis protein n=1 Tax=Propylenella binzhouense TaxID=2555902 RepID=A0A964T8U2_9HYPH|nr:bifunctional adenosylcobinamide kinase/adenosylcobinamide-phosphate guanylyltransferase [Propylenella binzhouense]MYZ49482.1 bifunctional adenosylcobinamide kinase/adenosylcobinamide-phosphate guanylyltransferase [Propylenella binzhouense]
MKAGSVLVLGGARSGKSAHAEALAAASGLERVYVATAEPRDAEMGERIAHHRARRGALWRTVEAPDALEQAVAAEAAPGRAVLVDCLTLWLSNLLLAGADLESRCRALSGLVGRLPGLLVLVSNEVGLGIVPENALARRFRDAQGRLNQDVAARADRVVFVAAGLPLSLKGPCE